MKSLKELGISPTPWMHSEGSIFDNQPNKKMIGDCFYGEPECKTQANGRLMAAAPVLYNALMNMVSVFERDRTKLYDIELDAIDNAKDALTKAAEED